MLKAAIVSVVDYCTRYAYATIAISLLIAGISTYYTVEHFAINTDVTKLISKDVPWRQREIAFDKLFPNRTERYILAVVEAPTSELASLARAELAEKLALDKALFTSVTQPGGSAFFRQNGLLFVPTEELAQITKPLARAALLIRSLVVDPSLRGVAGVVGFVLAGVSGNLRQGRGDDRGRPCRPPGELLMERAAQRQAGDAERSAKVHPGYPSARFQRAGAGQAGD
jgi:hypothetical protein